MATLAELRARVNNAQKSQNNFDNSTIFSFSKLKAGDEVRIRFVPDGDPNNDFFWRVRSTRQIPFNSIKLANGTILNNRCRVSVPAFNLKKGDQNLSNLSADYLYESTDDPIQQKIKGFWGDSQESKDLYYRYAKRDTYVYQGFIRTPGYETKLYRFIISKQVHELIYSFMSNSEINDIPSDPVHGRDFILRVNEKSAPINGVMTIVKDYSKSSWSYSESSLTDGELAWLSENNPWILSNFISKRPSADQEQVMLELYEASYNGEPYDVNRWLNIFKPDNVQFDEFGNIVDKKDGTTAQTAAEIPSAPAYQQVSMPNIQQATVQPSVATINQAPVFPQTTQVTNIAPVADGSMMFNQSPAAQVVTQPTLAAQVITQPTLASKVVTQDVPSQTAPQLIQQNTVPVQGSNPNEVINDIMAKFGIR